MKVDLWLLAVFAGCAVVTFVPRVLPFVVVRKLSLPAPFRKWLNNIPVCLLTALLVQGMLRPHESDAGYGVDWLNLAIAVPTLAVAVRTRSLLPTVAAGVACAALLRLLAGSLLG